MKHFFTGQPINTVDHLIISTKVLGYEGRSHSFNVSSTDRAFPVPLEYFSGAVCAHADMGAVEKDDFPLTSQTYDTGIAATVPSGVTVAVLVLDVLLCRRLLRYSFCSPSDDFVQQPLVGMCCQMLPSLDVVLVAGVAEYGRTDASKQGQCHFQTSAATLEVFYQLFHRVLKERTLS